MPSIVTVGEEQWVSLGVAHLLLCVDFDKSSFPDWNEKMTLDVPLGWRLSVCAFG